MKLKLENHFFVFNPKSYLFGDKLIEYAKVADQMAKKYPHIQVFVTAPYADLYRLNLETENIIVTAQHFDGIEPGRGMGAVLPDSLANVGVKATFLNHAEHPLSLADLSAAIKRAKELGIITIVCADSVEEAKAIATLDVDILLCEPTELIGTGKTSDRSYIEKTNHAIKTINSEVLIMQAAGVSTAEDVYQIIAQGADGTGCTSGIVKASDPKQMIIDMIEAVNKGIGG
ncbi:triose-phosphate isomerase [Facklamia miroungae]|uniref:Triosephosphate isomerase (TIM) n=1 Tax=Facklamia miroungae TaxID=120956 RepID=A0A1G7UC28_9LACT|nr:triose-phosphate isomerase [Facklamia miroungae]NKZ30050.1 triose-phosphate isomerase [Facklamia miroungae]SDG45017.1 triosephosphate isomerase (TIM) [Facklamia miroungae]